MTKMGNSGFKVCGLIGRRPEAWVMVGIYISACWASMTYHQSRCTHLGKSELAQVITSLNLSRAGTLPSCVQIVYEISLH
jgi:hypothetical protein